MDAIWTSVAAVVGTLLGSVITHAFQRSASRRGELFTRSEALRQERIATYSAFAEAVEQYRHGQAQRWYGKQEDRGPAGQTYRAARDEAHRLIRPGHQTRDAEARQAIEEFGARAAPLVR